ncbi:MAG: DoxX family protein [Myxococcales bacterium]|nr:DoxX family protein [Myxococcales bacterium]MBL8716820.1 DoxX family protein [Myxococcales bacterium]
MDRRAVVRPIVALAMTAVGVMHFVSPAGFVKIVPPWLPAPLLLVYVSGVAEIAGGVGLLIPPLRRLAAWGLVALFVAVFPANVYMAMNDIQPFAAHVSRAAQWMRLPFQAVFIAIAVWLAREPRG